MGVYVNKTLINSLSDLVTPTNLRDASKCQKQALLYAGDSNDKYAPEHAKFGHAFGKAAALIVEHADEVIGVRLGKAFTSVFEYIAYDESVSYKNIGTLYNALTQLDRLWQNEYKKAYEYVSTEQRIEVTVIKDGKVYMRLGGAYDLLVQDRSDGSYVVFDFKAVSSEFMYNWASEPQILHYSLLLKLLYPDTPIYKLGSYLVAVFLQQGTFLERRRNVAGFANSIWNHVSNCKQLYDSICGFKAAATVDVLNVNPRECFKRSPCTYANVCYSDSNMVYVPRKDDRVFTDHNHIEMDYNDFAELVNELRNDMLKHDSFEKAIHVSPEISTLLSAADVLNMFTVESDDSVSNLLRGT